MHSSSPSPLPRLRSRRAAWIRPLLRSALGFPAAVLLFLTGPGPVAAQVPDNVINVRVSLKVIVSPATGTVPSDSKGNLMNDALLREAFRDMNRWLPNNWRGYRIQLVDLDASGNFRRVGTQSKPAIPSDPSNTEKNPAIWYSTELKVPYGGAPSDIDNQRFETTAKANKAAFIWNDTAINIYMNNKGWSSANFPSANRDVIATGYGLLRDGAATGQTWADSYKVAGNLLHEIGHSFELYHTFNSANDDGIADTAPDNATADGRNETAVRNTLAQLSHSKNYSALSTAEKQIVDNTANNAMSYYQLFYDNPPTGKVIPDAERFGPTRFVFTPLQMDKWADWANKPPRRATVSGTMRFVDASTPSSGFGTSTSPMKTLSIAVSSANAGGGDILLLRPGTYTAATLTKPMTLRATPQGAVTLKKP